MINELKACKDRKGLADLLGVSLKDLTFTLFKIPDPLKYTSFCVSKKSGGVRHILAPCPRLKWLQGQLLNLLYACEDDLVTSRKTKPNLTYGFRRNVSIFDNANIHRGKAYVFNLDITDFFDQFNFGRIRGFFIKDQRFLLNAHVATAIAQIACFDNKLPQGSPCSPHIADLASQFLDNRISRFLRPRKCVYSRYADDISISTNLDTFPADIATFASGPPGLWQISPIFEDLINRSGFSVNPKKVRMSDYYSRQMVTGLVTNKYPNITREFYLNTRAMCDRIFRTGQVSVPDICNNFGDSCLGANNISIKTPADAMMVLEGRLSHIHYIKEKSDRRTIQEKQKDPTQAWTTLQMFYLYKYFFGNKKPLVLTEGPSDIYYLRSAIISDKNKYPFLSANSPSGPLSIQFFKFTGLASQLLGMLGGTGNIKRFLYLYNKNQAKFNKIVRSHPIIIVVDNDSGGKDVINMINGVFKKSISLKDPEMVHQIAKHLYLVKTNYIGKKVETSIEDLLPDSLKSVKLNGKTFSPDSEIDTSKHFGKMILAQYIRSTATQIDFSGFNQLLSGINKAIADAYI